MIAACLFHCLVPKCSVRANCNLLYDVERALDLRTTKHVSFVCERRYLNANTSVNCKQVL